MWYLLGRRTRPSRGRLGALAVGLVVVCSFVAGLVGVMAADDGSPGTADTSVQASTQSGLTVTPSEISFRTVSVGDRETTTVTVANESPETIMVGDVRVSGDTSAFEITNPDVERIRQLSP